MATDKSDPFPSLPRRSFFAAEPANNLGIQIKIRGLLPALEGTRVADNLAVAKAAIEKAEKRKRGRPVAPKPWIEAGVSRMTWYRRKKGEAK